MHNYFLIKFVPPLHTCVLSLQHPGGEEVLLEQAGEPSVAECGL